LNSMKLARIDSVSHLVHNKETIMTSENNKEVKPVLKRLPQS